MKQLLKPLVNSMPFFGAVYAAWHLTHAWQGGLLVACYLVWLPRQP